jgi:hypothetical protein
VKTLFVCYRRHSIKSSCLNSKLLFSFGFFNPDGGGLSLLVVKVDPGFMSGESPGHSKVKQMVVKNYLWQIV